MILLSGTLFVFVLSCAKVHIANERFCADKGRLGAVCDYINSGPPKRYSKEDWDQIRFGMVCTDAAAITRLLGVIRKFCFDSGRCTYEEYKELERNVRRVYSNIHPEI